MVDAEAAIAEIIGIARARLGRGRVGEGGIREGGQGQDAMAGRHLAFEAAVVVDRMPAFVAIIKGGVDKVDHGFQPECGKRGVKCLK